MGGVLSFIRRRGSRGGQFTLVAALLAGWPAVVAATPQQRAADGVILGTVTDTSLRPLGGAEAAIVLTGVRVVSNADGRFRITTVPPGAYLVAIRKVGFRPIAAQVRVEANDTLRLALTLESVATELGAVMIVEANQSQRLQEFDKRRQFGGGKFFTAAEIKAINPVTIGDVLRRAPGVRVAGFAQSSRQQTRCPMAIYLDGIPVMGRGVQAPASLAELPPPSTLAGVEVYAGAATVPSWLPLPPPPHSLGCGAILLWTQDGSGEPPR